MARWAQLGEHGGDVGGERGLDFDGNAAERMEKTQAAGVQGLAVEED